MISLKPIKHGALDIAILRMLYENPDSTYAEIAAKLKTTAVTVHNRLKKMKENGSYRRSIVVNPTFYGKNINAYILVSTTPGKERLVAEKIAKNNQALKVRGVTGDVDIIVEVVASDIDELQRMVMAKIRALPGVQRTHTVIVAFTTKDEISYMAESI